MKNLILLFSSLLSIHSFNILNNYIPSSYHKHFFLCDSIHPNMRETFYEATKNINKYHIHHLSLKQGYTEPIDGNNINDVCSYDGMNGYYGYTKTFGTNETDIYISNTLLNTQNTLYNVIYHEFIHSLGLNHTIDKDGIMNYKMRTEINGNILEDSNKLYVSMDDIKGLRYIKNNLCELD